MCSAFVFSTSGEMGRAATVAYKRPASSYPLSVNNPTYSLIMDWLRCQSSSSLLRSIVLCLRLLIRRNHVPYTPLDVESIRSSPPCGILNPLLHVLSLRIEPLYDQIAMLSFITHSVQVAVCACWLSAHTHTQLIQQWPCVEHAQSSDV